MTLTIPPVPAYWGPLYERQWVLSRTGRRFMGWLAARPEEQAHELRAAIRAHDSERADAADLPGWVTRWREAAA